MGCFAPKVPPRCMPSPTCKLSQHLRIFGGIAALQLAAACTTWCTRLGCDLFACTQASQTCSYSYTTHLPSLAPPAAAAICFFVETDPRPHHPQQAGCRCGATVPEYHHVHQRAAEGDNPAGKWCALHCMCTKSARHWCFLCSALMCPVSGSACYTLVSCVLLWIKGDYHGIMRCMWVRSRWSQVGGRAHCSSRQLRVPFDQRSSTPEVAEAWVGLWQSCLRARTSGRPYA